MPLNIIHYLTYPTAGTYACGADAVGRRDTKRDCDPLNTTCDACRRNPDMTRACFEKLGKIMVDAVGESKVKEAYGTDDLYFIGSAALRYRDINWDGTLN